MSKKKCIFSSIIFTASIATASSMPTAEEEHRWQEDLAYNHKAVQKKITENKGDSEKEISSINGSMNQLDHIIDTIEKKMITLLCESEENSADHGTAQSQNIITLANSFSPDIPQWIRTALETSPTIKITRLNNDFYVVGSNPNTFFKLNQGDHTMVLTRENGIEELVGYNKHFRIFRTSAQEAQ